MKPDIEKVRGFAAELRKLRAPECTSNEAKAVLEVALVTLGEVAIDLEHFGAESAAAE
jgi:hypothetical protein